MTPEAPKSPVSIIAEAVNELDLAESTAVEVAEHAVSRLVETGYAIAPSGDVEILTRIRWTVDGCSPMDLKDDFADGFNAAMRRIDQVLHPAAAASATTKKADNG